MADNTNNYCACTGDTPIYTIELAQQGPPGPKGDTGEQGPRGQDSKIDILTSTPDTYILQFTSGSLVWNSPNLLADASVLVDNLDNKLTARIDTLNNDLTTLDSKVDTQVNLLNTTVNTVNDINTKVETNTSDINNLKTTTGNLETNKLDKNTYLTDKGTFALKTELPKVATVDNIGLVKPDGQTITIDSNGVLTGANQSEFDKYFTTSYDTSSNRLTVTQKQGSLLFKGNYEVKLETKVLGSSTEVGGLLIQGGELQFYEGVPGISSYFVGTKDGLYFNNSRLLTVDNLIAGTGINISIADQYGNKTISATGTSIAEIPIASATTLGGIKVGRNLTIEADGTLNAQAGGGGGGTTSTDSIYGNAGYYSTHYGILDCPNGLIQYNATGTDVTVSAGMVLQCAGTTSKTTIASPISKSLTSTGRITLFYAGGDLLEAGKVDYQEEEPVNDGIDNYQAWFKPSEGLWYFKSNDTGNVYRTITATPLANINIVDGNITRVDYIGYRILDDDILIHRAELDNLLSTIEDLTRRVTALENNINGGNA